jgi:hypothetical protein
MRFSTVSVPDDLAAMGIDHPHLRWEDARRYIGRLKAAAFPRIDTTLAKIMIEGHAFDNAAVRYPWVSPDDIADANLWAQPRFPGIQL